MKRKLLGLLIALVSATISFGTVAFAAPGEPQNIETQVGPAKILNRVDKLTAQDYNIMIGSIDSFIQSVEINYPEIDGNWSPLRNWTSSDAVYHWTAYNCSLPQGVSQIKYRVTFAVVDRGETISWTNEYAVNFSNKTVIYNFGIEDWVYNMQDTVDVFPQNSNFFIFLGSYLPEDWH